MAAGSANGQTLYNPSRSGTLLPQQSWAVTYGDGSGASGLVYADKAVVGEVTATRQAVEAATSASSLFIQDTNSDGIMGLAFSSINSVRPTPQRTFFDTVKSQLARPLFTALLKKGAAGKYDFGFVNASSYTGAITYTNVLTTPKPGFWSFNATGYSVGNGNIVTKNIPGIVDTGTTLFYLPSDVVAAYYGKIPGAYSSSYFGGWILPCTSTPPAFSSVIGGSLITMPGAHLIYGAVDASNNCYGGIQENTGIGFSIYGLIFLKSQFVVFDQTTSTAPRIGFAKQPGVSYT
ncbi:Peptidase A1 [Macrophomina phaseolina MS6]|uniref:Peptidase A1 n=2 Tax=Macrophomina phaseolina TaxID=35725 RepID=K2S322_MACPH|nr:Peptidase A1 [Macrophomina phaseolina MS6]